MRRPPSLILLFALTALAACAARPTPGNSAGVAYAAAIETGTSESRTPAPTWTLPFAPSATLTYPPVLTATPIVLCPETQGTVQAIQVPSPTLHYDIDAFLYLPPCYNTGHDYYPVLYLIHGLNYKEDQWNRLGAPAAADALTTAGEIAPLIIVMPRDRLDPRLDLAFVTDLVPYIDQHYHTRPYREFRAIGGLSRGGGWAVHLGLRYPDLFSRIGAHSPAVFYGDDSNVLQWARHLPAAERPVVYEDIGDNDPLGRSAAWLDQVLTWFDIPHTYLVQPGAHTEAYWSAHVAEYLRFYATGWRAASPTPVPDINP